MRLSKILSFSIISSIISSILIQPLGLVAPVFAEEVRMEYTDPNHIHAPKVVSVCSSALQCASDDYEYDANGNLVNDGERRIEWNQDNLPTRIEKDGQLVEFFYDANGRRIVKKSGGDKITYVSGSYQLSTINNQQSSAKYYFANGKRVAAKHASPTSGAEQSLQLHSDHLGSTVLATDTNSQPLSNSLSYFPYGSSINYQQLTISNYLFTGQELDDELGLYNYNARLYNPKTGAFVSADMVGSGNRYSYAKNNPLIFTDPTGHAVDAGGGGGGGLGITPPSTTPNLPVIEATTPINPTVRYDPLNPDPSYYDPYTPGEFERVIVGMAAFSSAAVTVVLAVPATVAYLSFLYKYYYYNYFPHQSPVPAGVTVRQALPGELTPTANVHPYSGAEGPPPGGFFLGNPETKTGEIVLDKQGWWEFKLPLVPAPGYEHEVEHWWQFVERGHEPAVSWPEFAYDEICAMEAELKLFQRWGYHYIPTLYEYETGYIQKEMSGWEEILTGWYNRGRGAYEGW